MTSPTTIGAYLALFYILGFLFLFATLVVGRLVRPKDPHAEKEEIYECGEPTIGSSYVQFDLRFYVVALLFIIFDVEVAFFFPWATVFGKTTNMAAASAPLVTATTDARVGLPRIAFSPAASDGFRELGFPDAATAPYLAPQPGDAGRSPEQRAELADQRVRGDARRLAWLSLADIGVFFAVLMVGFAYVWKRGDLDWVRAMSRPQNASVPRPAAEPHEPALSA